MQSETIILSEITSASSGRDRHLFLETRLKDEGKEGFILTVLDGESVWDGTLSEEDLDEQCAKLKMDFDTYIKETKAAFTQENVSDQSFECHFKSAATSAQLSWKKIPAHDVKYHLGSVTLKKCQNSAAKICEIFSRCIAQTQALQNQVQSLESDNERLSIERQNALKRLDKCVTAKEQLEQDLYSKFALVLNSKKTHIQDLEQQLHSTQAGEGASTPQACSTFKDNVEPPASRKTAKNKNGKTFRQSSASLSDDNEEDTEEEVSSPKKSKVSASSKREKMEEESFLKLSEDEEQESKLAPAARRPQRQKATKKQMPAKPTLPRVSSGDAQDRPSSAGTRSSLRKSGSGESNKSAENLDPDDLLNNF